MMQTNRTSKPSFMAALAALVLSCAMAAPAGARPDGDEDKVAATVQPADVTALNGKAITYDTRNDYVTTNRPQENGKMFVLYNVGSKKFLNVGSYWGTHAALSNVPRLFWLQRRNEKPVSPSWGYVRYPETPGMSEGSFKKNFFALTTMQVGSLERSKQSDGKTEKTVAPHAYYEYVRYYAPGSSTPVNIIENYTATGEADGFMATASNVDLLNKGGHIEARIDMSACEGNGSSTDGVTHMETLLSFGADIAHWNYNGMAQNNLHIFGFKKDDKSYIRVCPIDASYSDATHKSGGNENKIDIGDDNIVTIVMGTNDYGNRYLKVNEVDCMPRVTEDKTSPIAPFFDLNAIQMGSLEGNTRSHGIYDYVRLVTAQSQDLADTCVVKQGAHYTDGARFYRQYKGNLGQWEVRADLDLTKCNTTTGDETVLSVGTDIANWASEAGYNLHFYYTPGNKTIKVNTAKGKSGSSTNAYKDHKNDNVDINDPRHVVLLVDQEGVHVDGKLVSGFDPASDDVLNYLLNSATSLQVGSRQGNASHAIYRSLTVTKAKRTFPDETEKWDKRPFMKTLDGNLKQWEIEVKMDLSTCTSGSNDENVLSIGTAIANWGLNAGENNLHLYYTPSSNSLQVAAVNSNNKGGIKTTKNPTDPTNVTITLNKNGLYLDGELVYGSFNGIIANLLDAATTALQVGSKEGNGSDALYKSFIFTEQAVKPDPVKPDPTFPVEGEAWIGNKFSTTVNGNLADNPIEATIDLSGCTGTSEDVLSIGTDIKNWGNGSGTDVDVDAHANNIHLYYTNGANFVNLDVVSKTKGYTQYRPAVTAGGTLTVKLTNEGLWINGTQIDDSQKKSGTTGVLAHVIDYLVTTATAMQVGSLQGTSRSHATYTALTAGGTSLLGTAQTQALVSLQADESGSTATSSDVEATDVPVAPEYVPFDDLTADGGKFSSETYNVSFADGDKIEATVDLSKATEANENILSMGNYIGKWLNDEKTSTNLHIYYAGTDADGDITMSAAFVNKANNNGLKRAFSIPASSPVMKLTLSKDGLIINGRNIFDTTDTIPAINYDADLVGNIVRFKYDTANNKFVHNTDGTLVEVKPGQDGYNTARGIKVSIATGYIYTDDAHGSETLPLFISSKFKQETTASSNEDVFFSWAPRLKNSDRKYGNVGLFADRGLPQPEISNTESLNCSQWFFEPAQPTATPDENGHNLYRIYLKMDNVQYVEREGQSGSYKMSEWKTRDGQHKYYLQGTKDNVYGNGLEDYYTGAVSTDVTLVDAVADNEGTDDLGLWKVIDIAEYNELFDSPESEMTNMLDLSFLLSDPSFSRENPNLTGWTMDKLDNHVRVGYDYYSKKTLDATDYTDEHGNKDRNSGGSLVEAGSNQYNAVKDRTNNHARYMGFDVRNNTEKGSIYQDVAVSNPGWYAVTCSGMSNVGAKLFVQVVDNNDKNNVSAPVEMPLHVTTEAELKFFNKPNVGWPFDKVDDTHPMPMYNALVAMNDRNIVGMKFTDDGTLVEDKDNATDLLADRYTSQVAFFVDSLVLKDNGGQMTLRLGVSVPAATATAAASGTATQATATRANEDATISSTDKWTVVDDFHLLFGGRSEEPNLVLNEDSTSLGYIDRSLHAFDARPMHLYRTFAAGKWNTIILPVNLSKSDFVKLFGNMADDTNTDGSQLAELHHLTKNTVEFVSVKDNDESGVMLKAFKPYIIKVKNANGNEQGQEAYEARLAQRRNSAEFEKVGVPKKHYYLDVATLEGKRTDELKQPSYSFKADTENKKQELTFTNSTAYTTGDLYTYCDNTLAERTDADETDGSLNISNLRAYGTLCKNYVTAGKVLDGHPDLRNGYVMQSNNLYKIRNQYGTKGFRCWFASDNDATGQLSPSTKVSIDGIVDGTTGIADIYGDTGAPVVARFADGVYTIDGRKVRGGTSLDGLPAGVYIVNGSKTVVSR